MGIFVLGVLVGWLAEWLFFTFWVKGDDGDNTADCTSIRTELMGKLDAKNSEIAVLKAELKDKSGVGVKKASIQSNNDKAITKKKAKAESESANKPVVKKAKTDKATKAKATKDKATIKKAVKIAPRKKSVTGNYGDDFTKLSGIGPSLAAKLRGIGITSYKELAAMDDDDLREKLEAAGARLNNNKDAMDSWNEQAILAAQGDFVGLRKLQEVLKK